MMAHQTHRFDTYGKMSSWLLLLVLTILFGSGCALISKLPWNEHELVRSLSLTCASCDGRTLPQPLRFCNSLKKIPSSVGRSMPRSRSCQTLCSHSPLTTTALNPEKVLSGDLWHKIALLVKERSEARWNGQYEKADEIKEQLFAIELPEGIALYLEDLPRSKGGGSIWKIMYANLREEGSISSETPSVLQLAHAALGLAVSCSKLMAPDAEKQFKLNSLVSQAKDLLEEWKLVQDRMGSDQEIQAIHNNTGWLSVETQLRGRKAADAAFWFALAGVVDEELFDLLTLVCTKELYRFGSKPSCRAKDIAQIMDRLAAAGIGSARHRELEKVARRCLQMKLQTDENDAVYNNDDMLDLHSDRCLLMLWKFSARQKKQQSFLQSAQKHWEKQQLDGNGILRTDNDGMGTKNQYNWEDHFEDPTRPLVLDLGCGMGISLLGLATMNAPLSCSRQDVLDTRLFSNCNFLGVDLSGLAVGYARGIAQRWGVSHKLQFVVDSAESLLESVRDCYPGPVSLCLIQFPTPYRLPTKVSSSSGNSQLPVSALDGFMVSPNLLELVRVVVSKGPASAHGKILLQSNCEDVALWMQRAAQNVSFEALGMLNPADHEHVNGADSYVLPQRTLNWIMMGGERTVGDTWSATPLLPPKGTTETETACRMNKTPIHRCVLSPMR